MAPTMTAERSFGFSGVGDPRIRPSNANMPPSPRLSAFRTKPTYLMLTTMVNDQKIREATPKRLVWLIATASGPLKHSRTA